MSQSRSTQGPARRSAQRGRQAPARLPARRAGTPALAGEVFEAFLENVPPELQAPDPATPSGRILEAARKLFAQKGFAASGTRAIAAEAQVNQAMLNYYFGSKERLYTAVIAAEFQAMIRSIAGRVDAALPAEEIIVELPIGILRELEDDPVRGSLLRQEIGSGAQHLKRAIEELGTAGPPGMRRLVRPLIEEAQAKGRLPKVPPDALLQFLLSVAYGALFLNPLFAVITGTDPDRPSARTRRRQAFERLLRRLLLEEAS